uniref:Furin-1 n=1 Tax=Schistosoma japonicum TaxID=6182 RepID=C1LG71_SCHJA|nr:Furin-1 precursor [Schistosoma japonicum]
MISLLIIIQLHVIKTVFSTCQQYYAVETDLSEGEIESLVADYGGIVTGSIPFQNVYEIYYSECNENEWPLFDFLKRSKRSSHETFQANIKSHPKIQHVKPLEILHVEKRLPVADEEFNDNTVKNLKKTPLPKEMYTETDAEYNRQYIEYARKVRTAVNVNDPAVQYVWQYLNDGNSVSPLIGLDMNIYPIFLEGITGRGTNVVVIDDGIDTNHPDLQDNYDETISINLDRPEENGFSPRGPRKVIPERDGHGTRCAGLAGAVMNNSFCSHGVAPNTKLGGIRILTAPITDTLEARGLSYKAESVNIFCSSWGPSDDGITMDLPRKYATTSLSHGIAKGRHGLGSIYVFASGNGGIFGDSCGADGFVSSPDVLAISVVDNLGRSTLYSEPCAAIRASVPIGGLLNSLDEGILPTTMENSKCMKSFMGTSAAAPLFAGCVALVLEANPKLTWRDISHLLPWSTRIPNPIDNGWLVNGAGLLHHPYIGFGTIDCYRMMKLAKQWNLIGPLCVLKYKNVVNNVPDNWAHLQGSKKEHAQHLFKCDENCLAGIVHQYKAHYTQSWPIKSKLNTTIYLNLTDLTGVTQYSTAQNVQENIPCRVDTVEQVILNMKWKHSCRGSIEIHLISPSGADALILGPRRLDTYSGEGSMIFSSVVHWGETAAGLWKLIIYDHGQCNIQNTSGNIINGFITSVELTIRGTSINDSGFVRNKNLLEPFLTTVGKRALQSATGHYLNANEVKNTFIEQRDSSFLLSKSIF